MKFLLAIMPTVFLAVYSQLVTKWRITRIMSLHQGNLDLGERLFLYVTDPYIVSAYVFSLLSSFAWMAVIEKYPVSSAFPSYMGVVFLAIALGSVFFFREPVSLRQVVGMAFIVLGVFLSSPTKGG